MNKDKLKKCLGYRLRVRPVARRRLGQRELPPIDDDWVIERWNEHSGITLHNIATGHVAVLAFDHVHHFSSDPAREIGALKYGFLQLNVQLCLKPYGLDIEPLPPSYFRRLTLDSRRTRKGRRAAQPKR